MLMFLQGRRGAAPDERYISATVRVSFAKDWDGRWLVDDLAVLTKPKPSETQNESSPQLSTRRGAAACHAPGAAAATAGPPWASAIARGADDGRITVCT